MAKLRVLTAQQSEHELRNSQQTAYFSVRDYHAKYYVPHNVGSKSIVP